MGYHGLAVDLATSTYAVPQRYAIREDAMRIAVARDGLVYFRNQRVTPEDLPRMIRESIAQRAERKIHLAVDSRARYFEVDAVIDQIRAAGVRDVSLLTEQVPDGQTAR